LVHNIMVECDLMAAMRDGARPAGMAVASIVRHILRKEFLIPSPPNLPVGGQAGGQGS